jgi:pimeloyl-ACP methyl ester carboxylesterase
MKNIKNCIVYLTLFALGMAISSCSASADTPQAGQNTLAAFDPVSMDPKVSDPEHPPTFGGRPLEIEGSRVNTLWWQPEGKGPNPTILLLHGYPGNEKNLDLARALQRAGFNVAFFHYRGTWGSAGYFTFSNALEDIAAVVDAIRSCSSDPECELPIDPDEIAFFGHSMGGWLAMLSAMEVPRISCAGILDFWEPEVTAYFNEHAEFPPWLKADEKGWVLEGSPLRIEAEGALGSDLLANVERFGLVGRSTDLAKQNLFILSTPDNEAHPIVVQALEVQEAKRLHAETWDTDHSFNDRRIRLARAMVDYFSNSCFK